MKYLKILYFLFLPINALINKNIIINKKPIYTKLNNKSNNKFEDYYKLTKANYIVPTFLLNFAGGFIANPSFNILLNTQFNIFTMESILLMLSSMVINDIFDIKTEKSNITTNEALTLYILLLSTIEILSLNFLDNYYQNIIHLSILLISLYTPILKKIPIIKNLFYSLIVTGAVYFSGNIFNSNSLLLITCSIVIFLKSLISEQLLDKKKYSFSNKTIKIILSVLFTVTTILLDSIFNFIYPGKIVFLIDSINFMVLFPLFVNFHNIKINNYSKDSINKYIDESNIILYVILSYYGILAFLIKN
jgi:hypothetical protein